MGQVRSLLAFCAVGTLLFSGPSTATAQDRYWDPINPTGNWNLTSNVWGLNPSGTFGQLWVQGANGFLQSNGNADVALDGNIIASQLTFNTPDSYHFFVTDGGGTLTLPSAAVIDLQGAGNYGIDVALAGANSLTLSGNANTSLHLNASNSFTGGVTIAPGVSLLIGDRNRGLSGSLSGNVSAGAGGTLGFQNTTTYNGVVSGAGNLSVSGPAGGAVVTLTNSQSYTGSTSIGQNSTLLLDNNGTTTSASIASSSIISIAVGSTLDVTQHTASPWTLQNNQTLRALGSTTTGGRILGSSRILGSIDLGVGSVPDGGVLRQEGGDMTLVGGATSTTRATYRWSIHNWTGTSPAAGTFDQIVGVNGAHLDLTQASLSNQVRLLIDPKGFLGNFDGTVDRSWTIADFSSGNASNGILGFSPDKFLIDLSFFGGAGSFSLSVDASSNQLFLNFTGVPEPHSLLCISLMGVAAIGVRRLARNSASILRN